MLAGISGVRPWAGGLFRMTYYGYGYWELDLGFISIIQHETDWLDASEMVTIEPRRE